MLVDAHGIDGESAMARALFGKSITPYLTTGLFCVAYFSYLGSHLVPTVYFWRTTCDLALANGDFIIYSHGVQTWNTGLRTHWMDESYEPMRVGPYEDGVWDFGVIVRKEDDCGDVIAVALWPIVLALGIVGVYTWLRRVHIPPVGACLKCGYNLTGNVSGRCPECASVVSH